MKTRLEKSDMTSGKTKEANKHRIIKHKKLKSNRKKYPSKLNFLINAIRRSSGFHEIE